MIWDSFRYIPHILFHPFDGFYEAKFRGKGSPAAATVLFILYGLTQIFTTQYRGFIDNFWHLYGIESRELFLAGVIPVFMFIVANWSTTTLMNGNGRFRDIYMVVCYSLVPLIIFGVITTIVSNALILEEIPILMAFDFIGALWFCFLIFSGLCVVHEYTAMRNVATLVVTFVAVIIILFLIVMYLTLMDKCIGFVRILWVEITKKW